MNCLCGNYIGLARWNGLKPDAGIGKSSRPSNAPRKRKPTTVECPFCYMPLTNVTTVENRRMLSDPDENGDHFFERMPSHLAALKCFVCGVTFFAPKELA